MEVKKRKRQGKIQMLNNQNKFLNLVIPLFVLLICSVLWMLVQTPEKIEIPSETAVWDLRNMSFDNNRYRVVGPVEYIENELLTPEEYALRRGEAVIGQPEMLAQYATSRMLILLPDDGYYTFTRRSVDYAHKLYANGALVSQVGEPGAFRETMTPNTGRVTVTLKAENGRIELIQQASIFVHREGDQHGMWTLTEGTALHQELRGEIYDSIQLGSFLALFFVHIILFLLLQTYRANLYFALFCLTWFLRTGVTSSKIFTAWIPWLPWTVKFRMEYLSFPVTAVLLVSLLNELFPGILKRWFCLVLYGWSAVFAMICLFADTVFMSHAMFYCELLYLPACIYILVCFIRKQRSLKPEQGVFLAGVILFLLATVYDILYYNGIRFVELSDLSQISMMMLAFCEAAAIFMATVQQIALAKEKEQQLAMENAALERVNRLRGNMMAVMGHEMRTPLTVMSVYAQLATENLRELSVDEQTTADLTMISNEAKRLAEMASGLLHMTKEQENRGAFEEVDLSALIRQVAGLSRSMLSKNNNKLNLDLQEGLPAVWANAGECTQILWNLIDNAARHTNDGEVTICMRRNEGLMMITVSDTGEGIPDELLSQIFQRGVGGSSDRSGLGLAICKEIIEAHGGTIDIVSEQRNGTVITFTLPISQKISN